MAVDVEIKEIEPGDIDILMDDLRQADRDEIEAITTQPLREVIESTVSLSSYAKAGWVNGDLICLWGVCPATLISKTGAPWFLATNRIEQYPLLFLRRCKPHLKTFKAHFKLLVNYVDARNTVAIHWLKWLGFKLEEAKPWGIKSLPFHKFTMRN